MKRSRSNHQQRISREWARNSRMVKRAAFSIDLLVTKGYRCQVLHQVMIESSECIKINDSRWRQTQKSRQLPHSAQGMMKRNNHSSGCFEWTGITNRKFCESFIKQDMQKWISHGFEGCRNQTSRFLPLKQRKINWKSNCRNLRLNMNLQEFRIAGVGICRKLPDDVNSRR